jgi:signal transduction histidine kinase/ligand-binding sensor domain-containing protein
MNTEAKLFFFLRYVHVVLSLFVLTFARERHLLAQDKLTFQHLTIDNGLSQNSVHCILQDRKGFMWFGTQDGLNRFDGYSVKVFKQEPFDTSSLSDNYIRCMIQDRDGFLWIGTVGGLNRFDPVTETFRRYTRASSRTSNLSYNSILSLYEDTLSSATKNGKEKIIWIGTDGNGLNKLVITDSSETFFHYFHNANNTHSISTNKVMSVKRDSRNLLWIGTSDGFVNYLNESADTFLRFSLDADGYVDAKVKKHYDVISILEDKKRRLWISVNGGGVHRGDIDTSNGSITLKFAHYHDIFANDYRNENVLFAGLIRTATLDKNGTFWFGTYLGISKLVVDSNDIPRHKNYIYDQANPSGLSFHIVTAIAFDSGGAMFVGTLGGGVDIWNPFQEKFILYKHDEKNPKSISSKSVRGIYEDDNGILWIGGYNGLNKFDRRLGLLKKYNLPNIDSINRFIRNLGNFYAIIEEPGSKGKILWCGLEYGGLLRFDVEREIFTRFFPNPTDTNSISDEWVGELFAEENGTIWIGNFNGILDKLVFSDKGKPRFIHYKNIPSDSNSFSGFRINCIYKDKSNVLWIGTQGGGLNALDLNSSDIKFSRYVTETKNTLSISSNQIKSILEDQHGNLWIGTDGGGLNKFDRTKKVFHYSENNGLPSNVIYGILEDQYGNLWLSTNRGLSRFEPHSETFKTYDMNDGLQGNEFNTRSYYQCKHGEMFFGGINGLNAFFPNEIADNKFIPKVWLTDMKIFNKHIPLGVSENGRIILPQHISDTKEIQLSYWENVFSLEFVALNFIAPEKNKYAYKMEGFNTDWIFTDANSRSATYTNLNAGDYIFLVQASNNDGVWNRKGTSLRIKILPPFWETWWFRAISIGIVFSLIAFISMRHVVRLKKEKIQEQEFSQQVLHHLEQERKRIAGEIHDGFNQNLLIAKTKLNLGKSLMRTDEMLAQEIEEVLSILSQAIQDARELSRGLHPHLLDELGLTKALDSLVEQTGESLGIECTFHIENVDNLFDAESQIGIYRIVQECLNNIVKHSKATFFSVNILRHENTVHILVEDHGIGFDAYQHAESNNTTSHWGFGLNNLRQRTQILDGKFTLTSARNVGTKLLFEIPFDKK